MPPPQQQHPFSLMRDRGYAGLGDPSPPESPRFAVASLSYPPLPAPPPGKPIPPPIDPGVFRSVTTIRRLIDEASELAVRASSGMSAAALGSIRGGSNANAHSSPWALAQSLGMNPLGDSPGGRNVAMSAMRIHRLRALAVQKLAAAYRADEIASSVMVMQGGSVFEDIAERVLKVGTSCFSLKFFYCVSHGLCEDPNDADAKYIHFHHEKIPSRFVFVSPSSAWVLFTRRGQVTCRVYYNLRSRRTHQSLSPATRAVSHTRHRPHIPGRVFGRGQRLHPCASGGPCFTQGPFLPSQCQSPATK